MCLPSRGGTRRSPDVGDFGLEYIGLNGNTTNSLRYKQLPRATGIPAVRPKVLCASCSMCVNTVMRSRVHSQQSRFMRSLAIEHHTMLVIRRHLHSCPHQLQPTDE